MIHIGLANLIAAVPPVLLAAVILRAFPDGRGGRIACWLVFAATCVLWASLIVPLPDGVQTGGRPEWLRRLSGVAMLPVGIGLGAAMLYRRHRHASGPPTAPGLCRSCGYDLRASPERCPECGTVPEVIT